MPVPTRPSTGGPVESAWGQEVHDQAFAPIAATFAGGGDVAPGVGIPLVARYDPAGWLAAPGFTLTCPLDGDGLYLVAARISMHNPAVCMRSAVLRISDGPDAADWAALAYGDANAFVDVEYTEVLRLIPGSTIVTLGAGPGGSTFRVIVLRIIRLGRAPGGV